MTVYYSNEKYNRVANSNELKPMIRISNNILYGMGFRVGQKIDVSYGDKSLQIKVSDL